jgi:hypothetical protein
MRGLRSAVQNWITKTSGMKLFFQVISVFCLTSSLYIISLFVQNQTPQAASLAAVSAGPSLEGTVLITVSDNFVTKSSVTDYYLITDNGGVDQKTKLNYTGAKKIKSGDRVRITGYTKTTAGFLISDNSVTGSNLTVISSSPGLLGSTTGTKRVAIVLVNWSNYGTSTPTPNTAYNVFNSQIKPFYDEVSYGKLTFDISQSDVYGWLKLDIPYSCDTFRYMYQYIYNSSIDAAVNFNNYTQIVLVSPVRQDACAEYAGIGIIGSAIIKTAEGNKQLMVSIINSQYFSLPVVSHEIGHNLGIAGHASGWGCGSLTFSESCIIHDYSDRYDIMSNNGANAYHFGAYFKNQLGWLSYLNFPTVTASGNYFIYPLESNLVSYAQGLKIYRIGSNSNFFTVENRTRTGSDSSIPASNLNGAIIKYYNGGPDTLKIDSTPNSNIDNDFDDGDWESNQEFNDCAGIKISPQGKSTFNGIDSVLQVYVEINPSAVPATFTDVPCGYKYFNSVETLYHFGYTAGCNTNPLKFCPNDFLNRGAAAVFMLKGKFGGTYTPPPATHIFADDWSKIIWAEPWAEAMYKNGISAGCATSPLKYCPLNMLNRGDTAIFGLRLKYGTTYYPPPATHIFGDNWIFITYAEPWAEQAYKEGIMPACGKINGKPSFCPEDLVTRGEGADVIVKAKNLKYP